MDCTLGAVKNCNLLRISCTGHSLIGWSSADLISARLQTAEYSWAKKACKNCEKAGNAAYNQSQWRRRERFLKWVWTAISLPSSERILHFFPLSCSAQSSQKYWEDFGWPLEGGLSNLQWAARKRKVEWHWRMWRLLFFSSATFFPFPLHNSPYLFRPLCTSLYQPAPLKSTPPPH